MNGHRIVPVAEIGRRLGPVVEDVDGVAGEAVDGNEVNLVETAADRAGLGEVFDATGDRRRGAREKQGECEKSYCAGG